MNAFAAVITRATRASPRTVPSSLARAAIRSLWYELALYPKPGLVSLLDSGAHTDMDASTFVRSLFALRSYFGEIAVAGAQGASFGTLRELALRAESAMLRATSGINTHRGAIFGLGLACAAAGRVIANGEALSDNTLRQTLLREWGQALHRHGVPDGEPSHGTLAQLRHGASGARGEARNAFPSVFEVALPALRDADARGCGSTRARLAAFFALLEHTEDTNVLHRGGRDGLAFVRESARGFRERGGVHAPDAVAHAERLHRDFVARRLSPGGCADLLAMTLFVDAVQRGSA